MSAKIIKGKEIADKIKLDLKQQIKNLTKKAIFPCLAVIIVGNNSASRIYVNKKKKMCEELGIKSIEHALDENTTEEALLNLIKKLNLDSTVNGILVQLPLPKHINSKNIIASIDPRKDVDGFHPTSLGNLISGNKGLIPCTPAGIMELLKEYEIEISGKECVIVGRSLIVGKPQGLLMLSLDGTVTICHSKTKNLEEICKCADILVVAAGRAEMITSSFVKPGAVVIDVGMNRLDNGKLVGDVQFESVSEVASYITPVPGGVGPMTIIMLMKNTILAATYQREEEDKNIGK